MRLLYFITFITAVLFSEVVMHAVAWDQDYVAFDIPMDDSNENENSEESKEDRSEEEKLIRGFYLMNLSEDDDLNVLSTMTYGLRSQSTQEVHSPPPDLF